MFFTNPTSTSLFCSLTLCCRSNPRKKFSLLLVKSRFYDCLDPHQGPFVTRKKNIHRSLFHDVEKSIQSIFLHWKIENMFLDFLILSRNLPATVMDWYTSDKYWNNPIIMECAIPFITKYNKIKISQTFLVCGFNPSVRY